MNRRSSLFVRALLAPAVVLLATAVAPADENASLQQRIVAMAQEYEKSTGAVAGIAIVDLRSDAAVAAWRESELFAPASNQKIVTSAVALARLGGDFQFTTTVYLADGNLVITGDFDPLLGDPVLAAAEGKSIYDDLDRWAAAVKAKVGSAFPGDIVLAVRTPAGGYRHEDWPVGQYDRWYVVPVAELNFNNNCFDVTFRAGEKGIEPVVEPQSRYIQVQSQLAGGSKQTWSAKDVPDESTVVLKGSVKSASTEPVSVSVSDPPMLLGRVFADRLQKVGVNFTGRIRKEDPAGVPMNRAEILCATRTPLARAIARANKRSLNMVAECILLRSGDGTWNGSDALAAQTLAQVFGIAGSDAVLRDGGGLSQKNRIAPRAMARLLMEVNRRPDAKILRDSLPVSGVDGTMQNRLKDAAYRGRVLGKTGYITGVSSLSGYVLDPTGRPAMAFSILCNKIKGAGEARQLQDAICMRLVDALGPTVELPQTTPTTTSEPATAPE